MLCFMITALHLAAEPTAPPTPPDLPFIPQTPWIRAPISDALIDRVQSYYLPLVEKAVACDETGAPLGPLPDPRTSTQVKATYRSPAPHEWLLSLQLQGNQCEGPADPEWAVHWFLITPHYIRFLGKED